MNITFSELIMSVFGVPVDFTASLQLGWKLGEEFCQVTGFLLTLLGMYSINIFTAISLYRFIFIKQNVSTFFCFLSACNIFDQSSGLLTDKRRLVMLMMVASLVWSLTMSLPPLLGWGHYTPEQNGMRLVEIVIL